VAAGGSLPDAADAGEDRAVREQPPEPRVREQPPEPSSEPEHPSATGEADDDVHFGVAAKALGVSRKTVERMVKRGELERGPSGARASVSKHDLVTMLEQRRRDVSHLTRAIAADGEPDESLATRLPEDAISELQELLRPALEPLLDEFVSGLPEQSGARRPTSPDDSAARVDTARDRAHRPPRALRVALATNVIVVVCSGLAALVLLVLVLQHGI